ncbi:ATP-binding protein [Thalassospira lucentensis]|uniref:ATP-binding protein n=1 Tax=Thalassospira lucentensis TaxID=168935 RepID=UPI003D2F213B
MAAIFLVGSTIALWSYQIQKAGLLDDAKHDLDLARRVFSFELNMIFEPAPVLYETLIDAGFPEKDDPKFSDTFFGLVTGAVRNLDQLDGAFIGFPDGRFYHVQDILFTGGDQPTGRSKLPANHIMRRAIDTPETDPVGKWFMQANGSKQWSSAPMAAKPYDPRQRGWYSLALGHEFGGWTDPYIFASSGKLGITFARPIYTRSGQLWAVMGVDLSLDALSQTLIRAGNAMAQLGDVIFATDFSDRVLAHRRSTEEGAANTVLPTPNAHNEDLEQALIDQVTQTGTVETISVNGSDYLATRLNLNPSTAMPLRVYFARSTDTVLKSASEGLYRNVALIFSLSVIVSLILFYAAKLRVEVSAREEAEDQLIAARDTAEAATRAKSTFLATMSHEIRTPMNGVMSMAELLGTTRLDSEQRRMSGVIHDSATALLTIINDILDFSKIEAGKLDIEAVEFSLMNIVDGAAELLAPKVEEKDISLLVDIDTELADLRIGDPVRLRQILLNLGGNAVKFTETGHVILRLVAANGDANRLRFEITDTGIGLTEDQLSNLFQPFTQAESSTTRKYGGTGLGLSICKRLVEMMGGDIGATSIKSQGSTFWFELPLTPVTPAAPTYDGDLSPLSVSLIGLTPQDQDLATRYLRAGGVTHIDALSDLPDLSDLTSQTDALRLVLIDSKISFNQAITGIDQNSTIGLVGPRNLLHDLPSDLSRLNPHRVMLPLSRTKLWHACAIAAGLIDPDDVETSDRTDLDFSPPDYGTAADHGALILVAEDNPTNQTVIRKMLDRMGFACEIHDDGQEALAAYRPSDHGLVLTDINMPRMSGYELTLALRGQEDGTDHHVPIFALTADALSGTERDCLEAGMDGYLTKPIDSRKLGAVLAKNLPAALPLRQMRTASPEDEQQADDLATSRPSDIVVDWDREILNPDAAIEIFGSLNAEAQAFITEASNSWDAKIENLQTALTNRDTRPARAEAHVLKGAALSIGAERFGRIAADIQDALDADDVDMADIMAPLLAPTLTEFREILPHIFAKIIEK